MTINVPTICLLVLFGCVISSADRADESPAPCASEWTKALHTTGTEYDQAKHAWQECQARADAQKKTDFAKTGYAWATGLDPLTSGGWALLGVHPDGISAVFGTRRHETRKGSVVAVWVRYEFRETQIKNGSSYKSAVERELYDCERINQKTVSVVFHDESNLAGAATSYTYDEEKVAWEPIPPGTLADQLLEWACRTSKAQTSKAQ